MTIDIIIDASGKERRCGSLPLPPGRVCSLPPFASAPNQILYKDAEIKEIVTDKTRLRSRERWGREWILDQGSYGSCNPTALAAAGARARYRRGIRDGLLFSGSYGYSKINGHRDQGSVILDDIDLCQKIGFCPLSLCPPSAIYPELQQPGLDAEAAKHKGLNAFHFVGDWATRMRALRSALASQIPCIVAVMAGNGYLNVDAKGVVKGVDPGAGNHAVLVDDLLWDGTRWLYDSPGSYGTDLGQDGRVYLIDATFKQTLGPHEFVAVSDYDEVG